MRRVDYELLDIDRARLCEAAIFNTPIAGHRGAIAEPTRACSLREDGSLLVAVGFVWDFGSGAIDTPDMIIASLAHDALCRLTNDGVVPWSVRAQADAYFRKLLRELGCSFVRRWYAFIAVRAYSLTLAHRDRIK